MVIRSSWFTVVDYLVDEAIAIVDAHKIETPRSILRMIDRNLE